MNKEKIFLTGATGFIGSNLTEKFVENGYKVVALVRSSSNTKFIDAYVKNRQVEIRNGDITQSRGLENLMEDCGLLVHAAAYVRDWGRKRDFYETNVTGTRNILNSAKKAGINSIILISSTAVLGEEDCLEAKPENAPYNSNFPYFLSRFESDMNHYRNSKMLAEKLAIDFCKKNKKDLTVVRPVWVYGPKEFHAGPYIFCKSILSGNRFFPGNKATKFHTIYVEDLSEMILRLIEKKKKGINIFNLGSEKVNTLEEFWGSFCDALGKKHPIYLPRKLIYPIGLGMELLYKLFKSKNAPLLTRARVEMGYCNNIYDTRKIRKEIGPFRDTPLKKGVEKTIRWWKDNGYL